jgi:hypothetical protein
MSHKSWTDLTYLDANGYAPDIGPAQERSRLSAMQRSERSREFERRWRSIPKAATVPTRREFSPRLFAPMLRHIMLLDFSTDGPPWSRIRVVGDGIRESVQSDLTSHDYLEFLAPRFHPGAAASVDLIFRHPCGLWQVMAAHYQRGFSQYLELTAFPIATEVGGGQMLSFLAPLRGHVVPMPPGLSVMSIDTAVTFEFLDIGAGVPAWPPQACGAALR